MPLSGTLIDWLSWEAPFYVYGNNYVRLRSPIRPTSENDAQNAFLGTMNIKIQFKNRLKRSVFQLRLDLNRIQNLKMIYSLRLPSSCFILFKTRSDEASKKRKVYVIRVLALRISPKRVSDGL